ncbi:G2/M phase-specific E3 ubiquitin-protein ligase-like [Oculina patagonica]
MSKVEPLNALFNNDETDNSDRESEDDSFLDRPAFGSPQVSQQENTKEKVPPQTVPPQTVPPQSVPPRVDGPDQLEDNTRQCNPDSVYVTLMREDPDINKAISINDEDDEVANGDAEEGSSMSNERTLIEALQDLQLQIYTQETSFINVRRAAIWSDTCRQLMRKRFSPRNRISVKFADSEGNSEGAVDVGGPKREFFRILVKAAKEESGIFIGKEGCKSLFPNSKAREEDRYRIVGLVLAWSLVHGGPAGNFLSPTLYNSVAYGPGVIPPRLEDVPLQHLRQKIEQIADSATLSQLQECLDDEEIQAIVEGQGATTFVKSIDEKEWYVRIILRHLLVDSTSYLLEDFKKGLQTLGVLEAVKRHPERFRDVFTNENLEPLDAAAVDTLFTFELAEVGSNERPKQELAIVNWRDYLQDCETGDTQASLSDVLAFATGAERQPILGFDTIPTIEFHNEIFPTANTCATILRIPTTHEEYEEFKSKMDFAILNSPCFGQA